jgi:hypothetical protein
MREGESSKPSVLLPYPGPEPREDVNDIFVYMRPETNGVVGESAVMGVVENCSAYRSEIKLVYLANLPGAYLMDRHVVEYHYAVKLVFATKGKQLFTEEMQRRFEDRFHVPFESAQIVGSFEALRLLGMSPDALFNAWVDPEDVLMVNGQSIKRIGSLYVVNYDVPALMHKNTRETDIAVMLFRTTTSYSYFSELVRKMRDRLVAEGVVSEKFASGRGFHYSKSPFEQLLDARGYLVGNDGEPVSLSNTSFGRFLLDRGIPPSAIEGILNHPIGCFRDGDGRVSEDSVFSATYQMSFPKALDVFKTMTAQYDFGL